MRKILSLGAAVAIAMVCLATPATAGPTRIPAPAGAVDLPDIFCGFGVHAEFPKNKEYSLIYSDAGGTVTHIRTTGALAVTLTNASNGHTHTFNISGPGDLVPNTDGSTTLTATGNWIFFFAPGQLGVGSPGSMVTFTGRTVLWTAANGFDQEIRSRTGTMSDVCATLA
jgi:hypothetical protein